MQKVDFGLMQIDTDYTDYLGFSWDASDAGGLVVNTAGYPGAFKASMCLCRVVLNL